MLAALPARERWGFVAARARRAATIPFDIFRATDRADTFLKGDAEALLPDRPELRRVHDAGAAR